MTPAETIGQRIRRERLERDMTQRDLAQQVEVGVPHISKIEAGRENPSDDLLERIAAALRLDVEELLLVARRVPQSYLERMAAEPEQALEFLRTWAPSRNQS